jgi:hypothetical protein
VEGQVPVFIYLRNRVAQLYPQALGFLFVASYDSQGYRGGNRPRLQMGVYNLSHIKIIPILSVTELKYEATVI